MVACALVGVDVAAVGVLGTPFAVRFGCETYLLKSRHGLDTKQSRPLGNFILQLGHHHGEVEGVAVEAAMFVIGVQVVQEEL